jgi:hypothetical protein
VATNAPPPFTVSDIAFGEALIRVSAHLDNAVEAYRSKDATTALVHANRSLELMPRISRELWRSPDLATALNQAAASVASTIRSRRSATESAAARDSFDRESARAVVSVVGDAASPAYRASVVVALLRTCVAAREAGFAEDAAAIAARARSLAGSLWGGAIRPEAVDVSFEALAGALEENDTPAIQEQVATIATYLHQSLGAVLDAEPSPSELRDAVIRLLDGVVDAVAAGETFRADKLAAQAYVEVYKQIKPRLVGWPDEPELDAILGSRIRLGVAAGEPIEALVEAARALLTSAPL